MANTNDKIKDSDYLDAIILFIRNYFKTDPDFKDIEKQIKIGRGYPFEHDKGVNIYLEHLNKLPQSNYEIRVLKFEYYEKYSTRDNNRDDSIRFIDERIAKFWEWLVADGTKTLYGKNPGEVYNVTFFTHADEKYTGVDYRINIDNKKRYGLFYLVVQKERDFYFNESDR